MLFECSICTETIEECCTTFNSQNSLFTTRCNHKFHNSCISNWCAINNSCPICRTKDVYPSSLRPSSRISRTTNLPTTSQSSGNIQTPRTRPNLYNNNIREFINTSVIDNLNINLINNYNNNNYNNYNNNSYILNNITTIRMTD
jgi:hypothetical protein